MGGPNGDRLEKYYLSADSASRPQYLTMWLGMAMIYCIGSLSSKVQTRTQTLLVATNLYTVTVTVGVEWGAQCIAMTTTVDVQSSVTLISR